MCNLCSGAVRFIAANDPSARFAFLPLQSPHAQSLLAASPRTARSSTDPRAPDSVILLENGRVYDRSDAALHIALGLRAPWPLAFGAVLIPRGIRDALYTWIARNRYRWFGRKDECPLPPPGLRERFLDPTVIAGPAAR